MDNSLELTKDLINVWIKSQWQTSGLPILLDTEGLDRALYTNENIDSDGNGQLYIAGTTSIKDLVNNDLTIRLILVRYTERYNQARQRYTDNKDTIQTSIYHSFGSVIWHHILEEHEQLNGRLYSTPSLAIPHDRTTCFSHYDNPIARCTLDTQARKLYLGNYTGYE